MGAIGSTAVIDRRVSQSDQPSLSPSSLSSPVQTVHVAPRLMATNSDDDTAALQLAERTSASPRPTPLLSPPSDDAPANLSPTNKAATRFVPESATGRDGDRCVTTVNGRVELPKVKGVDAAYGATSNAVTTSRYNALTFVPLNLLEQFSNVANVYFLLIGVLQIVPQLTTTNGIPTQYEPLAFIVLVSAIRAAKEDYDKHVADSKRNGYEYAMLHDGKFTPTPSGSLRVGHIVKINENEMIPADCILLGSSLAKGHAFIDKANLNGETRLEVVSSLNATRLLCANDESTARMKLSLTYEPPNKHFDTFRGVLTVNDRVQTSVDGKSLIMRECTLRNTAFIYALIAYTGNDTKIQRSNLDGDKPKVKRSRIMGMVQTLLAAMATMQILLCFIGGVLAGTYRNTSSDYWYLDWSGEGGYSAPVFGVLAFFTWFILLASMVPISLIVSAELIKFTQSRFIASDIHLFHAAINKGGRVNSSTIHEDLGQIDYIFSDKTGTLTQNKMEFRYAVLAGGETDHVKPTDAVVRGDQRFEFGSQETDIARSVKARQVELAERYKLQRRDSAVAIRNTDEEAEKSTGGGMVAGRQVSWTKLNAQFYPKKLPRDRDGGCCARNFPIITKTFWNAKRRTQEESDAEERGDASPSVDDHIIDTARKTSPPPAAAAAANVFSDAEAAELLDALWGGAKSGESSAECIERQSLLRQLMTHMALSNTVRPYDDNGVLKYQAESAEELAMVQWAARMGFVKRSLNPVVLEVRTVNGAVVREVYNQLAVFGFTSARARVTVVYQRVDDVNDATINQIQDERKVRSDRRATAVEDSASAAASGGKATSIIDVPPSKSAVCSVGDVDSDRDSLLRAAERQLIAKSSDVTDRSIVMMTKGQDSVILPLVSLTQRGVNEGALMLKLKDMSLNGLRTLVLGESILSCGWWRERADKYNDVVSRDTSAASDGHPVRCARETGGCEKCAQHRLYDEYEQSAALTYIGTIGLEDQLQPLVPECIADCLRAGIKVWMITGDKLDTAKNIGLACNLIDADMMVDIDHNVTTASLLRSVAQSRLIQVTGQWAAQASDESEMGHLFDCLDGDGNGVIDVEELRIILTALQVRFDETKLNRITANMTPTEIANDESKTEVDTAPMKPVHVRQASGRSFKGISKAMFLRLIKSIKPSAYDAVLFDVDSGIKTFNAIQDHNVYPISVLIDRAAFQVMFPGKSSAETSSGPSAADLESLRTKFFELASRSKSVVFARAEPAMKKRMVTEVQKRRPNALTLAIGDGANDTDMIQAAHIGVGIAGVEGTAATNAADYAVGTFRMLHTLLFVHGVWSYHRASAIVYFLFYKSSLVAVSMFLFGFFSRFSGQQFFDDSIYQLYNVIYTAVPILFIGVLDQPLPAPVLENNPIIYKRTKGTLFTYKQFAGWLIRAVLHALICFFFPYAAFAVDDVNDSSGQSNDVYFFSTTTYFCIVLVPSAVVFVLMNNVTALYVGAVLFGLFCLFLFNFLANTTWLLHYDPYIFGVVDRLYNNGAFWLVCLLTVATCFLAEIAWRAAWRELRPSLIDIFQEITKQSSRAGVNSDGVAIKTIPMAQSRQQLDIEVSRTQTEHDKLKSRPPRGVASLFFTSKHDATTHALHDTDDERQRKSIVKAILRFKTMSGYNADTLIQRNSSTIAVGNKDGVRDLHPISEETHETTTHSRPATALQHTTATTANQTADKTQHVFTT